MFKLSRMCGHCITEAAIWKGLRKIINTPACTTILYKAIHIAYRINNFWTCIPAYKNQELCPRCHFIVDIDHILTAYMAELASLIWNLAQETWPDTLKLWLNVSLGLILAGGTLTTPEEVESGQNRNKDKEARILRKSTKRGRDRLLQLLVSESAHLIWVRSCHKQMLPHSRGNHV